jgi:hypothetical protein
MRELRGLELRGSRYVCAKHLSPFYYLSINSKLGRLSILCIGAFLGVMYHADMTGRTS